MLQQIFEKEKNRCPGNCMCVCKAANRRSDIYNDRFLVTAKGRPKSLNSCFRLHRLAAQGFRPFVGLSAQATSSFARYCCCSGHLNRAWSVCHLVICACVHG